MTAPTDRTEVLQAFRQVVNMTPAQLTRWLSQDASHRVGTRSVRARESTGHRSGRRIVRLLEKEPAQLNSGDIAHMRKVIGYVHRHLAQRPAGDISETPWRYSLMNWGHDPQRKPG